ncbi:MAG: DUF3137 domain-containing protein [Alphaproteobacteria bacterium]|nr:DUF3137 domain-containing protein [Alphaproteobacteria bacterium]
MSDSTILKLDEHEQIEDIKPADESEFSSAIGVLTSRAEDFRMEKMRRYSARSSLSLFIGIVILLAGATGFGWYFLMEGKLLEALLCLIPGFLIPAGLHYWAAEPVRSYRQEFKTRFMPELAHTLGGMKFYPSRGISENFVKKSGIMPAFDQYKAEDCFIGRHAGVKVILSEARLFLKKKPVFDGVLALLDVETEHFDGATIVTANPSLKRHLARSLKSCPVNLPGYEHSLSVYTSQNSSNPLASDERLLKEFHEMSVLFDNAPLSAIFWHGHYVFIAIPYAIDMFECSSLFVPVTTHNTALQCRKEIEQLLSIIDVVRLYKKQP